MKKKSLLDLIMERYQYDEQTSRGLILAGKVYVNEKKITKPGLKFKLNEPVKVKQTSHYVSRAAYKLVFALQEFNIKPAGRICLDIGCSTGGFSQVLIEAGAQRVYAVDCGNNQFDYRLRTEKRIILYENKRIQDFSTHDLIKGEQPDLVVMDVSFTSCLPIIQAVFKEFSFNEMITLIKPQFEYSGLQKKLSLPGEFNGVIKTEAARLKILDRILLELEKNSFKVHAYRASPITGRKGNLEYLVYLGR